MGNTRRSIWVRVHPGSRRPGIIGLRDGDPADAQKALADLVARLPAV